MMTKMAQLGKLEFELLQHSPLFSEQQFELFGQQEEPQQVSPEAQQEVDLWQHTGPGQQYVPQSYPVTKIIGLYIYIDRSYFLLIILLLSSS